MYYNCYSTIQTMRKDHHNNHDHCSFNIAPGPQNACVHSFYTSLNKSSEITTFLNNYVHSISIDVRNVVLHTTIKISQI